MAFLFHALLFVVSFSPYSALPPSFISYAWLSSAERRPDEGHSAVVLLSAASSPSLHHSVNSAYFSFLLQEVENSHTDLLELPEDLEYVSKAAG